MWQCISKDDIEGNPIYAVLGLLKIQLVAIFSLLKSKKPFVMTTANFPWVKALRKLKDDIGKKLNTHKYGFVALNWLLTIIAHTESKHCTNWEQIGAVNGSVALKAPIFLSLRSETDLWF